MKNSTENSQFGAGYGEPSFRLKRAFVYFIVAVALTLAAVGFLFQYYSLGNYLNAMLGKGFLWLPLPIFAAVVRLLSISVRRLVISDFLGGSARFKDSFIVTAASSGMRPLFPPVIYETSAILGFRRFNLEYIKCFNLVAIDHFFDFAVVPLIVAFGTLLLLPRPHGFLLFAAAIILWLNSNVGVIRRFWITLLAFFIPPTRNFMLYFHQTLLALDRKIYAKLFAASLGVHLFPFVAIWASLYIVGIHLPAGEMFGIYPISDLVMAIPGILGNVGSREVALAILYDGIADTKQLVAACGLINLTIHLSLAVISFPFFLLLLAIFKRKK
ncbi:MAG: hypothetical protein Kow0090_03830 [Myxococcota bacterium]